MNKIKENKKKILTAVFAISMIAILLLSCTVYKNHNNTEKTAKPVEIVDTLTSKDLSDSDLDKAEGKIFDKTTRKPVENVKLTVTNKETAGHYGTAPMPVHSEKNVLYEPSLWIFIAIQLINVIISTIKSIVTINGSRVSASVINAISYTFAAVITKLLTQQSFEVAIAVTFITNIVGVWLGKYIMDKREPERLWTVNATVRGKEKKALEERLLKRSIQFVLLPAENDRYLYTIFARSKAESSLLQEILADFNVKYNIVVSREDFS